MNDRRRADAVQCPIRWQFPLHAVPRIYRRSPNVAALTRVAWVGALLVSCIFGLTAAPVSAEPLAPRPIRPDFFGVQDDTQRNNSPVWRTARIWGAWCSVQPRASMNVQQAARRVLGQAFALHGAAGRSRVTVSLGHPPPWVYANHRQATRPGNPRVWYCGAPRSVTAFPTVQSLTAGPVHNAYVRYVAAVIGSAKPFLAAHPVNRLVLQAWNEPNLGNGGKIKYKIPGAARTWVQAAESLRTQERIMRAVAQKLIPGRYEITTPAMTGRKTRLGTPYFRAQARARTVDSVSLNFYTRKSKSVNSSLKRWRFEAARAKRLVTRYKTLRRVPIWITETNHQLVNRKRDRRNLKPRWSAPAPQKRMAEVSTMEAIRLGFAGLEWYQGTRTQTAVNTRPGAPATQSIRALRAQLQGRSLVACRVGRKRTTCSFSARHGNPPIQVTWSRTGTAGVTILR